jgi:2-oxoglutarate dehydrogenase E1 component
MGKDFKGSSHLFGANAVFVEELYNSFLNDPTSVDREWRTFFGELNENQKAAISCTRSPSWGGTIAKVVGAAVAPAEAIKKKKDLSSGLGVLNMQLFLEEYRNNGHLLADLDPLGIEKKKTAHELRLAPSFYGFGEGDYDKQVEVVDPNLGVERITIRNLMATLGELYSSTIGYEFSHITSLEQKDWLCKQIEQQYNKAFLGKEEKKELLKDLLELEGFEQFLHSRFPGTKRFSVEGGESSIVAVNEVIKTAANETGVREAIIGMPHRGRLNVLTKIMKKSYSSMFSEFQGNVGNVEWLDVSGDVKYHMGKSADFEVDGRKIHLSLSANPSHLEAVNPVVTGRVRAKQDKYKDFERVSVMGILLHGDAAFAGQGVVAETLSLSDLVGYCTGGTVHVVVNNQVGFTTSPDKARAGRYPTEIAKIIQAPIIHVNGDDPEAVIKASRIAEQFRQKFKEDVVLDIVCYRLHGHNEGDEPFFTQPLMYSNIKSRETTATIYSSKLIAKGVISEEEIEGLRGDFKAFLDKEFEASKDYKPNKAEWLEGRWEGIERYDKAGINKPKTGVSVEVLKEVGYRLCSVPEDFKLHPRLVRILSIKSEAIKTGDGIDWATAEALAFGALLKEGCPIRLSGQDSGRGTFSQRHSVLIDQENESKYLPLNNICEGQAEYEVIDSNLSEFAVLGFEYGYSTVDPNHLVMWEGQFGDFSNGAQVIIDQFISSAEFKWLRMSGLTMLLPHGYEGQGPEHSSARLERYLQLCAEGNMSVVNCTTPANYFHVLRRQVNSKYRKPLIVMAPKSLLRHKSVVSSFSEMKEGTHFLPVIGEREKLSEKIKRVIVCGGKVYYDLMKYREDRGIKNVAVIRIEQYYPFPKEELYDELKKYKNVEVLWCQEEPKNMGAWRFIFSYIENVLLKVGGKVMGPVYVGRANSASPATGYLKVHNKEQEEFMHEAFK